MSTLKPIVDACGGVLLDGGRRALIPGPGHSAGDRSVSLALTDDGRILIWCFSPRDDWRSVRDELRKRGLLEGDAALNAPSRAPLPAARRMRSEDRRERAMRWWREARPQPATPAARYLAMRAITEAPDKALRFHPAMTCLEDRERRPALLAAITDDAGALQGVQATLLSTHGAAKAPLATPRRVIGALMGGAVRLFEAEATLVIAEGVETALTAASALGLPAWSALSAQNLSVFSPPACVDHLVIAADNDGAGHKAAEGLFERLRGHMRVSVEPAPEGHNDWNDWARAGAQWPD